MDRAVRFYEPVFGFNLERHDPGPLEMACFPFRDEAMNSPGSLLKSECRKPLMDGVRIYFTAHSGDMTVIPGRAYGQHPGENILKSDGEQMGFHIVSSARII